MENKNEISQGKLTYVSPSIEVTEFEFEQNILDGSGTSDGLPDLTDDLW
ncbi:hypothetical protein [Proteiniphilum sp. UBA5384]|nr:hypothetical protein [Proteiniphilum sp. UBA5384]